MSEPEDEGPTGGGEAHPSRALVARPLAAWWIVFAGLVVGLLFVLTDHMLRATAAVGGTLLFAAVLRATLPETRLGGLGVRGRITDVVILVCLGAAVLVSGFTLDLTAR